MEKVIPQIKRHLPDVVLAISLYLFCLNIAAFKLGDSHEMRQALYQ